MKNALPLALLLACGLGPGCTTYRSWRFGPSPQDHEIVVGTPQIVIVRAQVAAGGLDELPGSSPSVVEMLFRLRVTNETAEPLELAPEAFELIDGGLHPFGKVVIQAAPGAGLAIAPKETKVFDLGFPLPEGSTPDTVDLTGMSLRFAVLHEGRVLAADARFERLYERYYDDDPWGHVGVGIGFTSVHCN